MEFQLLLLKTGLPIGYTRMATKMSRATTRRVVNREAVQVPQGPYYDGESRSGHEVDSMNAACMIYPY